MFLRPDLFEWQKGHTTPKLAFDGRLSSFVTRFAREYTPPDKNKSAARSENPAKVLDISRERGWKVPHDLTFENSNVERAREFRAPRT